MKHKYIIKIIIVLLILFLVLVLYLLDLRNGELEMYFLDVGQGDSILIRSPDREYMLVDGGPDSGVLSQIGDVLPFWVTKIDYVLLTHPDLDHVGGLPAVIERYEVGMVYMVDVEGTNESYRELKRVIEEEGISMRDVREFDDFELGCCVEIDVLWPDESLVYAEVGRPNNLSTVFELRYGDFNAFFAGDLDFEIEDQIVDWHPIDIDLLKVSHHGSLTSTSEYFLEVVQPELAVIGVGKNNKFNHPRPEILDRLDDIDATVLRTDESGTIKVSTDGVDVRY